MKRRNFIKRSVQGLAAAPFFLALLDRQDLQLQAAELIKPSDPLAKTLGYVEDTKNANKEKYKQWKPNQNCANCIQYTAAADSKQGPCKIFPDPSNPGKFKLVKAEGWCSVWAKKA